MCLYHVVIVIGERITPILKYTGARDDNSGNEANVYPCTDSQCACFSLARGRSEVDAEGIAADRAGPWS